MAVLANRELGMAGVVTVEPDLTLVVNDRVVDVRYGAHGKIFGFYKDKKPGEEDKLLQDLAAVSFDKPFTADWGLTQLAFIPRNQLIRESEWEKMKGEKHGD